MLEGAPFGKKRHSLDTGRGEPVSFTILLRALLVYARSTECKPKLQRLSGG